MRGSATRLLLAAAMVLPVTSCSSSENPAPEMADLGEPGTSSPGVSPTLRTQDVFDIALTPATHKEDVVWRDHGDGSAAPVTVISHGQVNVEAVCDGQEPLMVWIRVGRQTPDFLTAKCRRQVPSRIQIITDTGARVRIRVDNPGSVRWQAMATDQSR